MYQDRPTISIASIDLELMNHINDITLNEITGRRIIPQQQAKKYKGKYSKWWKAQFSSKAFYHFCLNVGIMPNKTYILETVNVPNNYFKDFLGGVIDGDGCYSVRKPHRKEVLRIQVVSGSKPFLEWLMEKCKHLLGTDGCIIPKKKADKTYVLYWIAYDAIKIANFVYRKAKYTLTRKREIAEKFLFDMEIEDLFDLLEWRNYLEKIGYRMDLGEVDRSIFIVGEEGENIFDSLFQFLNEHRSVTVYGNSDFLEIKKEEFDYKVVVKAKDGNGNWKKQKRLNSQEDVQNFILASLQGVKSIRTLGLCRARWVM